MDFLNTRCVPRGETLEWLESGRAFLDWLVLVELIERADATRLRRRCGLDALDAAAAEARRVREWARGWIARWRVAPHADYSREVAQLNELLARAAVHREIVAGAGALRLTERHPLDSLDELIAILATQIALLITSEDPALVKQCADADCTLSFLDRTKSHRRMFCSASACGNRAKVAAFRERQRNE